MKQKWSIALVLPFALMSVAQDGAPPSSKPDDPAPQQGRRRRPRLPVVIPADPSVPDVAAADVSAAIGRSVELLLSMQESLDGEDQPKAEWPYEGVYRFNGEIPIGYRVGGTGIVAQALVLAPGYVGDRPRKEAVSRALKFVCDMRDHPLMNPDYDGGYDVRAWGYIYAADFLMTLKQRGAVPEDQAEDAQDCATSYIQAIQLTEIPQIGGWNYVRQPGKKSTGQPSTFMTAAALQTLFTARELGFDVDHGVVERALLALERARLESGAFVYSGAAKDRSRDAVPGSVGRMPICEVTLHLAGRSSIASIRGALDGFITHWAWLDQRRAQHGTHAPPYGVAPYYFYFAHRYAAQAVELLPESERAEYRRRINGLLFSVRLEDGGWNDRVFPRTANFGTAFALMAIMQPDLPPPAKWKSPASP